jgi:hypothetical protein
MDCTAAKDETETLLSFSLYRGFGYRYNVTMTQSEMITLQSAAATPRAPAATDGAHGMQS